ncbi:SUN domain-containing protein 3-like [Tympanuchus pallidicinctus]|uniref:SUN domain-containing protein 3-like n=1 Tax=Tympanuchus pallidicinctus TaxID=109042 RepID=UPI0022870B2E|nr:SUN domain-containing protein 3-like [Tympanuchus pallidicinctus]
MVPSQVLNICCSVVVFCTVQIRPASPFFTTLLLLCRQPKAWKTVSLLLFTVTVMSFGVYCVGSLAGGSRAVEKKTSRLVGDDLEMLRVEQELKKIQQQLRFLQWGVKDITLRALHEALKRTELPGFTGEAVQEMINQVLEKLEESPFQMRNYASKTSGAAIVRSKTSPSWIGSGKAFWHSLLLTPYMRPPEIILEPDNQPGNCWPFPGSQGHVLIKLPRAIFPTAVTLNHGVPATAYCADSTSSAPKDFAVYGLQEEGDEEGTLLGEFTFTPGQDPSQTFQLQNEHSGFINYIKLRVLSNWGHPDYTCVYQFRLHGNPAPDGEAKGKPLGSPFVEESPDLSP